MSSVKKTPKERAPKRTLEQAWLDQGLSVAGVDEVGRGAWAGPVVAAAVVLDPAYRLKKVRDSKLLTADEREGLVDRIHAKARGVGVGVVTVAEINTHGLSWAIREAGCRALDALPQLPDGVLLDGNWDYFAGRCKCETLIKGDSRELCIAAASVIAKVYRDGLMRELGRQYPEYKFALNKGYGTPHHRRRLVDLGPSPVHRRFWKPVAAAAQTELPFTVPDVAVA